MKPSERKDWQKDPGQITGNRVQIWTVGGTMATARCPLFDARELVARGKAFVISYQAIGYCEVPVVMTLERATRNSHSRDPKGYVLFGAREQGCREWFQRWYPSAEAAERYAAKRGWVIERGS